MDKETREMLKKVEIRGSDQMVNRMLAYWKTNRPKMSSRLKKERMLKPTATLIAMEVRSQAQDLQASGMSRSEAMLMAGEELMMMSPESEDQTDEMQMVKSLLRKRSGKTMS